MKSYVVRITDTGPIDMSNRAQIVQAPDVGRAVQIAFDELIQEYGADFELPLFVDVHPVEQDATIAWMYDRTTGDLGNKAKLTPSIVPEPVKSSR